MDEQAKAAIDAAFDRQRTEADAARATALAQEEKRNEFLSRFYAVRDKTIRPALDEVAAYLRGRGVEASVEQSDFAKGHEAVQPASIAFILHVGQFNRYSAVPYPRLVFICDEKGAHVRTHENTMVEGRGGQAADTGKATLEEIDEAFVQTRAAHLVAQIVV